MKTQALWLPLLLCGCATWHGEKPPCPRPEMDTVLVLPVRGSPPGKENQFAEILAAELVQFPGIENAVRPSELKGLLAAENLEFTEPAQLKELVDKLPVDAILSANLFQFDMSNPPRAAIRAAFTLGENARREHFDPESMVRSGTGSARPPNGEPGVVQTERVFDAGTHKTSEALSLYAWRNVSEVSGLTRQQRVRRIGSCFFRFICEQTIKDLFSRLKKRPSHDRSKRGNRELVRSKG